MDNHKIEANPVLHEIICLGYGTMIYKNCSESSVCPAEFIKVNKSSECYFIHYIEEIS